MQFSLRTAIVLYCYLLIAISLHQIDAKDAVNDIDSFKNKEIVLKNMVPDLSALNYASIRDSTSGYFEKLLAAWQNLKYAPSMILKGVKIRVRRKSSRNWYRYRFHLQMHHSQWLCPMSTSPQLTVKNCVSSFRSIWSSVKLSAHSMKTMSMEIAINGPFDSLTWATSSMKVFGPWTTIISHEPPSSTNNAPSFTSTGCWATRKFCFRNGIFMITITGARSHDR